MIIEMLAAMWWCVGEVDESWWVMMEFGEKDCRRRARSMNMNEGCHLGLGLGRRLLLFTPGFG